MAEFCNGKIAVINTITGFKIGKLDTQICKEKTGFVRGQVE